MDSMTSGKWKDIAEIIALVAIVVSLVAVAIELRQTQVALQSQAYQAREPPLLIGKLSEKK